LVIPAPPGAQLGGGVPESLPLPELELLPLLDPESTPPSDPEPELPPEPELLDVEPLVEPEACPPSSPDKATQISLRHASPELQVPFP
jgi:hypothetical protein